MKVLIKQLHSSPILFMQKIFLAISLLFLTTAGYTTNITGSVTNSKGEILPFASITVAGTSKGAVANSEGRYTVSLTAGTYRLICESIGYQAAERLVTLEAQGSITVNFTLQLQSLKLAEVVIKNGVDPATEIMRQTIKKRPYYNNQVDSFTVDVYIKGLLRSKAIPAKFLGQKIERGSMKREGIDSAGKGILFLSESVTKVAFARPDKIKYEVVSTRQSGGGLGISLPFFINFYTNNVTVFDNNINKRGFISPLADGAFHYYRFHYEGEFVENGRLIDRIKVTPKRKNEPLFEGFIQIVDEEWRLHSVELTTTSAYGLELIDTLKITQVHKPVTAAVWRTQNQVVYVAAKKFGFDISGNFLNVYDHYNLQPGLRKKFFNRILMAYDSASRRKDSAYWSATRPVPLEHDEKQNFVFRDSVARADRDSMYSPRVRDSLRRVQKPVKAKQFFIGGFRRYGYNKKSYHTYSFSPLLKALEYNTVEGLAINVAQTLTGASRKGKYRYALSLSSRYGVSNTHLNVYSDLTIRPKSRDYRGQYLQLSGGKRVWQINRDNPIDALTNEIYTLALKKNYLKLYESWYGKVEYNNRFESGLRYNIGVMAEERLPLENTTDFSIGKKDRLLLPNHPYELAAIPFNKHQALVAEATVSYQPGQRYIQFPRYKAAAGSKYPTLEAYYAKGIHKILGSDADFDKWKFSVYDNINFKIAGELKYRFSIGGFINNSKVQLPDYQHFNGNQTLFNFKYLNSFQLAPYYQYSHTEQFYALAHVEHHFNGLLTNKIPLFNRLKWYLVAGNNTFFVNHNNYYVEAFAGIENLFKILRIDFVTAYQAGPGHNFGIRLGLGGLIGGLAAAGKR